MSPDRRPPTPDEPGLDVLEHVSSDVIARFDRALRHHYVSPSVERATGLPRGRFQGRSHREMGFPEPFVSLWEAGLMRVFESGEETSIRFEFPSPGGPRTFHVQLAPETDADGCVRHAIATARDVTALLRVETELRERGRLLAEAQRLAQLGFWEWWPATGVVKWTDELYRMFGHEPGAIQPSIEAFLAALPAEDGQRVRETLDRALAQRSDFSYEHRVLRADGTQRLLLGKGQVEVDAEGAILRVFGTAQDITERREMEHEMVRRAAELEQARELDRVKSQFVGSVSHELRTPLSSIQGYAELLEDGVGGALSEQQRNFVEQIERGARRLATLVDDLLDFARLESGNFRFQFGDEDLAGKLREVLDSFAPLARERGVTLQPALPDGPLRVRCDAHRVAQVLSNMVSNALKFMPRGGRVTVRAGVEAGFVRVEVVDTGIGIAAKDLPRLFQRFAQLDATNTRAVGGTGLGLSISKAIVEAHGGEIGVSSEPGAGSTFWFMLPIDGPGPAPPP